MQASLSVSRARQKFSKVVPNVLAMTRLASPNVELFPACSPLHNLLVNSERLSRIRQMRTEAIGDIDNTQLPNIRQYLKGILR